MCLNFVTSEPYKIFLMPKLPNYGMYVVKLIDV